MDIHEGSATTMTCEIREREIDRRVLSLSAAVCLPWLTMAAAAEAIRISASSAELVLCLRPPPPPPRRFPLKSMALLSIRSGFRLPDLGEECVAASGGGGCGGEGP